MPVHNLLALIDDIATLLDDVSILSKVAIKKTAGVVGDDLALNAEQVTGISTERELPVVWAVAKGALVNKAILIPFALLISTVFPVAILPLLMLGGIYLCYEGFHKVAEKFLSKGAETKQESSARRLASLSNPDIDIVAYEKEKIKGAIRTDFVLSAEIVVITLGTVEKEPLLRQLGVLLAVSILITLVVYGLVAAIVKLDDIGLYCRQKKGVLQRLGIFILNLAPVLMRGIGVIGTLAMFMVGGGIVSHGISLASQIIEGLSHRLELIPGIGIFLGGMSAAALNGLVGMATGALALGLVAAVKRLAKI